MSRRIRIAEIMTPDVITVSPSTPMSEVRRILTRGSFHHLPVLDGDTPVGMISTNDMLRIMQKQTMASGQDRNDAIDRAATVAEVMQTDLITMRENDHVERAVDLLAEGERHSVLIVDGDEKLVGIVTNVDVLEWLFD